MQKFDMTHFWFDRGLVIFLKVFHFLCSLMSDALRNFLQLENASLKINFLVLYNLILSH